MWIKRYAMAGALLAITACGTVDTTTPAQEEQLNTLTRDDEGGSVVIHSSIGGSSGIKNWRVLDNSHMIFETYQHGDLIATFSMPCHGIRTAETIGLNTLGPFELDKFTKVLLPDGRWCHIKELKPFIKLEQ